MCINKKQPLQGRDGKRPYPPDPEGDLAELVKPGAFDLLSCYVA